MTLKENIMKLQTYKMFEGEDTLYVERDDVLKLLEQEIESIKDKILDNYDNSKGDGVREECLDIIDNAIYGGRHYTCSDCILDLTDACSRGAGRAVDDEICEDFLTDKGEQESEV